MAWNTFESFENGNLSNWSNPDGDSSAEVNTADVVDGSYSFEFTSSHNSNTILNAYSRGSSLGKVEKFRYFYKESSNNQECGVGFYDSSGNLIIAAGTNNPQYTYNNGSESRVGTGNAEYDRWTVVEFNFDWDAGTVDITWDQGPGGGNDNKSVTNVGLNSSNGIADVRIGKLTGDSNRSNAIHIDNLQYDPGVQQYGAIKVQTNSGVKTLPLYETGSSGESVHETWRVKTPSGVSFIPLTNPSDAAFPYLRVQTQNNGVLAAHNSVRTQVLIEGFEDANLNKYGGDVNATTSGSGSQVFEVQSGTVYEGSQALKMYEDTGSNHKIGSTTGLDHYPSAGDSFEFYWRLEGSKPEVRMIYGKVDDSNNSEGYVIKISDRGGFVELLKDNSTTIGSDSSSPPTNEWCRTVVNWGSSGDHDLTFYDSSGNEFASITGSDSTYSSGGIGWVIRGYWDGTETVYVDSLRLLSF